MTIKELINNTKSRLSVLVAISSTLFPSLLTLTLDENGILLLDTLGWVLFSIMGALILGLLVKLLLNNPIGIGESFLALLLFLLATVVTLYIYIKGYVSREDNPKIFIINITGATINFCGSIVQIANIFYKSMKQQHPNQVDKFSGIEDGISEQGTFTSTRSTQSGTTLNQTDDS